MSDKVVVTGLGVVSPIGDTLEDYWNNLLYGRSVPQDFPYGNDRRFYWVEDRSFSGVALGAGEAPEGRATTFAIRATELALEDAGFVPGRHVDGMGVSVGTAMGESDLLSLEREGGPKVNPMRTCFFRVGAALADRFQLTGPNLSLSTACSSGGIGLSLARDALLDGRAEVMLAVGTEAFSRVAVSCLNRMGALDRLCRPFDAERTGTVLGEGAATLVLESVGHALRRGRDRWYAEIKGYGWSCDGYHATAPEPSGRQIELSIRRALEDSSLMPDDIGCVIPHGTGTVLNDLTESEALERVFGSAVERLLVCADKSQLGHTSGAAGTFSCLTAALILDRGMVPPTANVRAVDPRCRVRLHLAEPVRAVVQNVLINSYGFGGNNISIIAGSSNGEPGQLE